MSFAIITFGCRVNQADSLALEGELRSRGLTAAAPEQADTIVVNTCSVTASADQGARQTIRRLARINPRGRIVVTGCYATRRPEELAALPNVVRVAGNDAKDGLAAQLDASDGGQTTAERSGDGDDACGARLAPGSGGRTALTMRVQTGCEEPCSYCIIPQTRGRGRSFPLSVVRRRIEMALDAGYKEVVVTGVHLGSYGRDLCDGSSLETLVGALAAVTRDVLFRISSLEPMDCTPAIVDAVAGSPRLAPHFHLPLQHGSDRMLRAMRRPYAADTYARLVEDIARRMPHVSIGSDVIVGFPGESEGDFETMRAFLERVPLTHLHVFPYSDRPGTEASRMPGTVDGAVIRERARIVRDIGAAKTRRFRASQAGAKMRALTVDDGRSAVTPNYLKLQLDVPQPRNEWVEVVCDGGDPLRGRVC
jgi:threonylcarbamoyladenosine tRNA methylthiotransferase MtaB